jgi:hypothetical protein
MLSVVGRGCGYVNNTAGDTVQVRFAAQAAHGKHVRNTVTQRLQFNSIDLDSETVRLSKWIFALVGLGTGSRRSVPHPAHPNSHLKLNFVAIQSLAESSGPRPSPGSVLEWVGRSFQGGRTDEVIKQDARMTAGITWSARARNQMHSPKASST